MGGGWVVRGWRIWDTMFQLLWDVSYTRMQGWQVSESVYILGNTYSPKKCKKSNPGNVGFKCLFSAIHGQTHRRVQWFLWKWKMKMTLLETKPIFFGDEIVPFPNVENTPLDLECVPFHDVEKGTRNTWQRDFHDAIDVHVKTFDVFFGERWRDLLSKETACSCSIG